MSYRDREIESKLIAYNTSLTDVNRILDTLFGGSKVRQIFGSSVDTYWRVDNSESPAQFVRMRERDGIRQITVKGKDRDTNLNRIEIDIDSTSDVRTISKLLTTVLGRAQGKVGKTYYVYWVGRGEHTTVCCYSIHLPDSAVQYPHVIVEVESTSEDSMLELEAQVLGEFSRYNIGIERAPGSLYEMFVEGK